MRGCKSHFVNELVVHSGVRHGADSWLEPTHSGHPVSGASLQVPREAGAIPRVSSDWGHSIRSRSALARPLMLSAAVRKGQRASTLSAGGALARAEERPHETPLRGCDVLGDRWHSRDRYRLHASSRSHRPGVGPGRDDRNSPGDEAHRSDREPAPPAVRRRQGIHPRAAAWIPGDAHHDPHPGHPESHDQEPERGVSRLRPRLRGPAFRRGPALVITWRDTGGQRGGGASAATCLRAHASSFVGRIPYFRALASIPAL